MMYNLKVILLIAHVERYFKNGLDIARVNGFIESGCIIQVNATSF